MKVRVSFVMLAVAAMLLPALSAAAKPGPKEKPTKIEVCHIPPGNPGNAHTITISDRAWKAHKGHGDTLGPCATERPGGDDINRRPDADAGADQCVLFDAQVTLDGTGSSDPDGDTLSYEWDDVFVPPTSNISDSSLSPNDDVPKPSFVPDQYGLYRFELEVKDPDGLADTDRVDVDVYMAVSLDKADYDVDEGATVPVVISLNKAAPRDLSVDVTVDVDPNEHEAAVVLASDDEVTDAVSKVDFVKGQLTRTVYILGVDEGADDTELIVSFGTSSCGSSDAADIEVDDTSTTSSLFGQLDKFVVRFFDFRIS